jgi:hypothetical protein
MKIHEIISEDIRTDAAKILVKEIAAEIAVLKNSGMSISTLADVATPRIRQMIANGNFSTSEIRAIWNAAYERAVGAGANTIAGFRLGLHYNDIVANLSWATTLFSLVPAIVDPIKNCFMAIAKENEKLTAKQISEKEYEGNVAQELTQLSAKLIANGIGAVIIKGFGNKIGSFFTGPFKFVDDAIGGMTNVARYEFFQKVANDPKWNQAIASVVIHDIIVDVVGGTMLDAFKYIKSGEVVSDLKYLVTHGELPPSKKKPDAPEISYQDEPIGPPPKFGDPGPRVGIVDAPTKDRPWNTKLNLEPSKY